MSSLQVMQINKHLEENYHQHIDVLDIQKSEREKIKALNSRSLAALAINMMTEASNIDACHAITDGFNDQGIDAIYFSDKENILLLVQAKHHQSGDGSIEVGELNKFLNGVSRLIQGRFNEFNAKISGRQKELLSILMNSQNRFNLIVIHSGKDEISSHCKAEIDDFLENNNEIGEKFYFSHINIKDIYKFISNGAAKKPIDEDVVVHNWSHLSGPIKSVYGQVAGSDLAHLFTKHGQFLFSPNIRFYLGNTDVNEGITATVQESPDLFWYFNNGITILCDKIEKKAIGGDTRDSGYFECKNLKVVNGAQTVGTLNSMIAKNSNNLNKVRVWARIIEVPESQQDLAMKVTRTNNTQNRIEKRDFVSLDPQQKRIADELRLENIQYLYKSGETASGRESYFDLTDATVSRACSNADVQYAVQAKREISKLWDDINSAPYTILFNKSVQGPNLYKEIVVLKKVDELLTGIKQEYSSKQQLLLTHGNRVILHFVYAKLDKKIYSDDFDVNEVNLFFDSLVSIIEEIIDNLYPDSYLASLFKNLTKCRALSKAVMDKINAI